MQSKKAGFTLIEILIVIALSAILMETIYTIYQKTNQSYTITTIKSGLYSQNLQTLDTIRKDIKKTNRILTNYSTYSSIDNHSIILQIPKLDTNKAPIAGEYYHVIYRQNPTEPTELQRIEIIDANTTTRTISQKISEIIFTPKNNLGNIIVGNIESTAQIMINLTIAETLKSHTYQSRLTSNETMRNK